MKDSEYLEMPWSIEDTIENLNRIKEMLKHTLVNANMDGKAESDVKELEFDFDRAIQALEEVEQYRAIGTVEELKSMKENGSFSGVDIDKLISRLEEEIPIYHGKMKEIVNQLAEEYKGGWIPCSERLPEKNDSVLCWAKSTARGGDVCFVGSCHNGFWFLQSSADTHTFPGQYVVVAWKPIEPYQKEGE